ncbi:MAG: zinc-dependent dehydrogenase [Candidatus Zipacnadales bacterium]
MKAALFRGVDNLAVENIPTPSPGPGEVLVRVRACAVCGSDVRIYHSGNPRVIPPQVIGHEIAGEVIEVGEGVTRFRPGDRVASGADVPCGVCPVCIQGRGNNCPINYAIGYQFPGGFAEYVLFNTTTVNFGPLHHIPENLSFEEAALAEPLACALNGLELVNLSVGESILIIGAGPAGLLMAQLARHMGATKIMLAQRSPTRLEWARQFDVDALIATQEEDLAERVMEETDTLGADVVVVACASPEAQEAAIGLAATRGRVNFFGGLPKGSPKIALDSNVIHYREIFVTGSHGSVPRQHQAALELLACGAVKATPLITHHMSLDQILEAFEIVESRTGMKVVIEP